MLYTFLIGWGLLFKWVRPDSAYLLIALPCLVPVAWYGYGFLNVADGRQDFGLLVSAAGWALIALALIIKHGAVTSAAAAGTAPAEAAATADTPLASILCAVFAVLLLAVGGAVSWQAWQQEINAGHGITD